ncbi:MAG: amidohydrolase family protein, partial [Gaiellaceae bacterium]
GMSAEDVLVATTKTAAELMGLESELGTIEPGKRADLVVVAGDPFDFSDLDRRIERVYQDGRLVVQATPEQVAVTV